MFRVKICLLWTRGCNSEDMRRQAYRHMSHSREFSISPDCPTLVFQCAHDCIQADMILSVAATLDTRSDSNITML